MDRYSTGAHLNTENPSDQTTAFSDEDNSSHGRVVIPVCEQLGEMATEFRDEVIFAEVHKEFPLSDKDVKMISNLKMEALSSHVDDPMQDNGKTATQDSESDENFNLAIKVEVGLESSKIEDKCSGIDAKIIRQDSQPITKDSLKDNHGYYLDEFTGLFANDEVRNDGSGIEKYEKDSNTDRESHYYLNEVTGQFDSDEKLNPSNLVKYENADESDMVLSTRINVSENTVYKKNNLKDRNSKRRKMEEDVKIKMNNNVVSNPVSEKVHLCDKCDYTSKLKKYLLRHKKLMHSGIWYACNHCNYTARRKVTLKAHKETTHEINGKVHSCDKCDYTSKLKNYLERHKKVMHSSIWYSCNQCDYTARQKVTLKAHKETTHKGVVYPCEICDYKGSSRANLRRHVAQHEGVTYKCDQCDNTYKYEFNLKGHIKSAHQGVRYSCDQCEYKAKWKSNLKEHKELVHAGFAYSCDQCDYKAKSKGHIKNHKESVHDGVTYPCDQCDYIAKMKRHLKDHKEAIHEDVTYSCDQCDYKAYTTRNVRRHKKAHHEVL